MEPTDSSEMASLAHEICEVVGRKPCVTYQGKMKQYDIGRSMGEYYAAFYGIPYAKNPDCGMKRFQAPESLPPNPSESIIPTLDEADMKICVQYSDVVKPPRYIGSLDCLYLHIFVPKKPELIEELLPVLVYIHGGGFRYSNLHHNEITPDSIIQHGVVFVRINYRLGIFGFLNMGTRDCPGNAGLKDQVKALEWIRDNIECFKGDPNNVTISGFSAGATCVNLHLIAPASKDLFHRAIVQSGGVYLPWGYQGDGREQQRALSEDPEFMDLLSKTNNSIELQKRADIVAVEDLRGRHPYLHTSIFGPTVEKFREGAFITDDIEDMMRKVEHNKPIIAGIAKAEGIVSLLNSDVNKRDTQTQIINDDQQFLEYLMDNFRWSKETAAEIIDDIRNKYFPDRLEGLEWKNRQSLAALYRDVEYRRFYDNFKFGPERAVHKNLYVYQFDHFSEISRAYGYSYLFYSFRDPTHGDENRYLYCSKEIKELYSESIYSGPGQNREIQIVMDHMCSLWANFCKTGVPESDFDIVEWERHTEGKPCYLSISNFLDLYEHESLFEDEWRWLNELVNLHPPDDSLSAPPEEEEE